MIVRRGAGGDGRGRQYCRPRPGRLHCATRARSLGSGREVSGCGDGSVGALGWPSLGPRARLPGLRDWERVTRAPLGGTPPPPIQALPCTASSTPPNSMVGSKTGQGCEPPARWDRLLGVEGVWEAGAPGIGGGRSRRQSVRLELPNFAKRPREQSGKPKVPEL